MQDVTIYHLAQRLNISAATVSRGLNNHPSISLKTKKRIWDMAKAMGYRSNMLASNLRKKRTLTIGVIVPKLRSYFISSVITGIEHVTSKEGYNLMIAQSQDSEQKEISNVATMFKSRIDGLLVSMASGTKDPSHFDLFFDRNIPTIFFDRVDYLRPCTNVVIDNVKAGYSVTNHLIRQGCKRIVHVTGDLSKNVYQDRFKGYKQALKEHHIPFKRPYLIVNSLEEKDGYETAARILDMKPLPDGIFISSDYCAAFCMKALKEANIAIPEDMAIVGFNDDPCSRIVCPKLSTVHYPAYEMGELVANQLIHYLNEKSSWPNRQTIILDSHLVIRDSSRRIYHSQRATECP